MQGKGHPEMIETTPDVRLPSDISLKTETKHRHPCQSAVTAGLENCQVKPERANDFSSDRFGWSIAFLSCRY
jgi:hypothetical protein